MHKIFKAKFFRKKSLFVEKPRKILNMFILFEYHQNLSQKIRILAKVCVEKHTQFNAVLPARAADNDATSAFLKQSFQKKSPARGQNAAPAATFAPATNIQTTYLNIFQQTRSDGCRAKVTAELKKASKNFSKLTTLCLPTPNFASPPTTFCNKKANLSICFSRHPFNISSLP